jgi:hypothetical protein
MLRALVAILGWCLAGFAAAQGTPPAAYVVVVEWAAPTLNTDGSPVGTLAGFGLEANRAQDFSGARLTWSLGAAQRSTVLTVPGGTWFWRMTATNTAGATSVPSLSVKTEEIYLTLANPTTFPKPFGRGERFTWNRNDAGFAVYWQCPTSQGLRHCGFVGRWSDLEPDWPAQFAIAANRGDAGLSALWSAKIKFLQPGDPDPYATVRPLFEALRAANPLSVSAPPAFVVKGAATLRTAAARAVVGGALGAATIGRVMVGAPCDCATFRSGDWCSVAGLENAATAVIDSLPASAAVCAASQ